MGSGAREVLLKAGIKPDFSAESQNVADKFDYIHHQLGHMDYYFVSNQNKESVQLKASFRIQGKHPELWYPLNGTTKEATAYEQIDGQTTVPLELEPYESVFAVFYKPIATNENGDAKKNSESYIPVTNLRGPWEVKFQKQLGGPESVQFDSLTGWQERREEGIKYYSGKATYVKHFRLPKKVTKETLFLELTQVEDVGIAQVFLNGKDLGFVWTPPFRVQLSGLLQNKNNKLEIVVINSWRNRLLGDSALPSDKQFTKTNIAIMEDWELLPAGLLGPVKIIKLAK